jgi:hypothetical protein
MKIIVSLTSLFSIVALSSYAAGPAPVTLRSLGAVGDGRTDDRAAIEAALNGAKGAPVYGEGATYAVQGNIEVSFDIDFRNATLVQTLKPADFRQFFPSAQGGGKLTVEPGEAFLGMVDGLPSLVANGVGTYPEDPILNQEQLKIVTPGIALRTLSVSGGEGRPVSVHLEKIKIHRGGEPGSGGRNDGGGLLVTHASPVRLSDVEVTGDGKGVGIRISKSNMVRLEKLNIHDMNWAPYRGDPVHEATSVISIRDNFGWNNYPIYEYREGLHRFVRVRIQEQLVGLYLQHLDDVELVDSEIHRLQTKIGGDDYPLQSDGVTINSVTHLVVRNCNISHVWEGIDFTGKAGSDFIYENCTASDNLSYGFKLAHPKQNGRLVNCRAIRNGLAGISIDSDSENITLVNCEALETGSDGYWTKSNGSRVIKIKGIRIEGKEGLTTPKGITIDRCRAINDEYAGAMDYGIFCAPDARGPEHEIRLIDSTAKGAKIADIEGFDEK